MSGNIYPITIDRAFLEKVSNFPDTVYSFNPTDNLTALMSALLGSSGTGQLTIAQTSASNTQDLPGIEYSDLDTIPGGIIGSGRIASEQYSTDLNPFTDQLTSAQWDAVNSADSAYRERLALMFTAINSGATVLGITLLAEAILGCKVRVLESWRYNSPISSISYSAGTYTFYCQNNFIPGQQIIINNTSISGYDGSWNISSATSTSFVASPAFTTSVTSSSFGGVATTLTNYSSLFKTSSVSEFAIVPLNDTPLNQQTIGSLAENVSFLAPANSIITVANQTFVDTCSYNSFSLTSASSATGGPLGYILSFTATGSSFYVGQPISIVGITGATGYNGSWTVATATGSSFTVYSSNNTSGTPTLTGSIAISNIVNDANSNVNYLGATILETQYNSIPSGTTIVGTYPGAILLSNAPTIFESSIPLTVMMTAYEVPISVKQVVADSEWFEFDKIVTVGKVPPNMVPVTNNTQASQFWINPNSSAPAPSFAHMSTSEEEVSLVSNIASVQAYVYHDNTTTSKKVPIAPPGSAKNIAGGITYSDWIQIPLADSPDNFPNGKYPGDPDHYTSFATSYGGSSQATFSSLQQNGLLVSMLTNVSTNGVGTVVADDGNTYSFSYTGLVFTSGSSGTGTLTGISFSGPLSATLTNNNLINLSISYNYEWTSQAAYVSYLTGLVTANGGQFNSANTQYRLPITAKYESVQPISLQQVVLPPSITVVGTVYGGQ